MCMCVHVCQYMHVNERVCSFEAGTEPCPVTRTVEVRPTEDRPTYCVLGSLRPHQKATHTTQNGRARGGAHRAKKNPSEVGP